MNDKPVEQYSTEWWLARRGKLTSSRMNTVVNGTWRGWTSLMDRLEQESGVLVFEEKFEPGREPPALAWGKRFEKVAVAEYQFEQGVLVTHPAFVVSQRNEHVGCSPDFVVPELGVNGEIKCPFNEVNHARVFMDRMLPDIYKAQVQSQMWVQELELSHFVSLNPKLPEGARLVVIEVPADEPYLRRMEDRIDQFLSYYLAGRRPGKGDLEKKTFAVKAGGGFSGKAFTTIPSLRRKTS